MICSCLAVLLDFYIDIKQLKKNQIQTFFDSNTSTMFAYFPLLKKSSKNTNPSVKVSLYFLSQVILSELYSLQRGALESVSKMMGHKNLKTTQIYAKIINEKISRDMEKIACKFNDFGERLVASL